MTLCILHLGSEKTGTSSIQKYFGQHRPALLREGFWYPRAFTNPAGHVHIRLSTAAADGTLAKNAPMAGEFREEWEQVRAKPLKAAVFSSEFFHSELRDAASIARLRDFLSSTFDRFRLVYYARRQDQMLASMHSTAVQGGWTTNPDARSVYETKGHYYFDHHAVCTLWASAFGRENLAVRVYERDKLLNGDIIDDFCRLIDLPLDAGRAKVASNESLSFETMWALILLNGSRHKDNKELRKKLIATGRRRGGKRIPMLTKAEARIFLDKFAAGNRAFFAEFVDPALAKDFTGAFDSFPDAVPSRPDAAALLDFVFAKAKGDAQR
jgi:hypothetical protein